MWRWLSRGSAWRGRGASGGTPPKELWGEFKFKQKKGSLHEKILKNAHLRGKKWGGGRQPFPAAQGGVGAEPYSIAGIEGFYHFFSSGRAGYVGRRSDVVAAEQKKGQMQTQMEEKMQGQSTRFTKASFAITIFHRQAPLTPIM